MNILLIGPYRQTDGWGIACKEYLLALLATKHNICCQPIFMGQSRTDDLPESIKQAEANRCEKYDVVIQNVLPHLAHFNKHYGKNVLLIHTESTFKYIHWPMYIDAMDEVWVPSSADRINLILSGSKAKIRIIGIPADLGKYMESHDNIKLPEDKFYFYFIGEYIQRKNIMDLVVAFHLEFNLSENVGLVLKLNKSGMNGYQLGQIVNQDISHVKTKLKLYKSLELYKPEYVIYDKITDSQLCGLHQQCHCFVMPSSGESWSLPAFDAMGFGNRPIVTQGIGPCDYVTEITGYHVDSLREQCLVTDAPIEYLYNSRETWLKPSIPSLRGAMRRAYEIRNEPEKLENIQTRGFAMAEKFSHREVARTLERILDE